MFQRATDTLGEIKFWHVVLGFVGALAANAAVLVIFHVALTNDIYFVVNLVLLLYFFFTRRWVALGWLAFLAIGFIALAAFWSSVPYF